MTNVLTDLTILVESVKTTIYKLDGQDTLEE